ncbi:MAG TPA: thioester reductase domain-containing protein [Thermoanaerobaculia bacterium]|nr:thioester reductase domain-containing protein [Thermoanaerobaculia bacterium]
MKNEDSDSGPGDVGDIAVVGMAGRFPGADSVDRLWELLRAGAEGTTRLGRDVLAAEGVDPALADHPQYVSVKGILEGAEQLDAPFFNLSPREAQITDPQQRVFLECAWQALEDAGCDPSRFAGAIGVFAGSSMSSYLLSNLLLNPALAETSALELRVANDRDFLATAVSYRLNLRGPSVNVATACSTSLVAVHLACQSLLNHECDAALAGGVSVSFPQRAGYLWQKGGIMSADGHCRAFDARASGTVGGEGAGVVVLRRLADALAGGDPVRAVIKGSAINNDGLQKAGFTAPSVQGQAEVIAEAQTVAGVEPDTITYIEAHGSGTPLGDSVEMRALNRAFQAVAERGKVCAVGSLKTNLGHMDAAAGVGGLIKTVLALEHRLLPASLHFESAGPELEIDSGPFFVNAALRPWESNGAPRRAGVSSFGIGGTNAHVIVEEAPEPEPADPGRPWSLTVLSAATAPALEALTGRLAEHLARAAADGLDTLPDIAYTSQVGRQAFPHRRAVVCRDRADAAAVLAARDPRRLLDGVAGGERPVAFLLSGVGDHYPGMGEGLYRGEPAFRRAFDRCAELLLPALGRDLREVVFRAPGAMAPEVPQAPEAGGPDLRRMLAGAAAGGLASATLAQTAVFAVEYALARLWESVGVRPRALLGYSLGEYTAACLAGVFSLEDGLRLVLERARLIESLPAGAMLAAGLSAEELAAELAAAGEGLALGAVNAPGLSVASGPAAPVAALEERLRGRGVACRLLPVSHALHSPMMEPIAGPFSRLLAGVPLRPPKIPYVTGVTGSWVTPDQACSPGHWVRHLLQTVRFAEGVAALWQAPGLALLEVGPGHGLVTLALQQGGGGDSLALPSLRPSYEPQDDRAFFLGAVGRLWTAGVEVSWPRLHSGERRRKVRLPGYPFERRPYRVDPPLRRPALSPVPVEPAGSAPDIDPVPAGPAENGLHPRPALPAPYAAPRSATEAAVAALWRSSFHLAEVGIHDNFFHLGGNSLLASALALRMEQALGVELPLRLLIERPTIAEIAAAAESLRAGASALPEPRLELWRDVVLDPAVSPQETGGAPAEPEAVVLTGATGFLGAFLLRDLLRETGAAVHCVVRAASAAQAAARIRDNLAGYGLWEEGMAGRIVPVPGDLGAPLWGMGEAAFRGLAERAGAVYHCGAWVSFTYPYSALRPVNVQGTHEALRLAARGPAKPVHFISTIAVFAPGSFTAEGIGREDSPLEATAGLFGGYGQSKWVAEKLLARGRERGIETAIYRPGAIGGDSTTGAGNPKDLIWSFLKGCIELGAAPALDALFDPAPVDFVSRAVVALAKRRESRGKAFHLFNPRPVPWADVFAYARALGYPLRELPVDAWLRELLAAVRGGAENALAPFWPLLAAGNAESPGALDSRLRFDGRNTGEELAGGSVVCPPVEALLETWFAHLIGSGFLPREGRDR